MSVVGSVDWAQEEPVESHLSIVPTVDGRPIRFRVHASHAGAVALKPTTGPGERPFWFPRSLTFAWHADQFARLDRAYWTSNGATLARLWERMPSWQPEPALRPGVVSGGLWCLLAARFVRQVAALTRTAAVRSSCRGRGVSCGNVSPVGE